MPERERAVERERKDPLTIDDLKRAYIRVKTEEGWGNVSLFAATDAQFDAWAKTRLPVRGAPGPWSLEERRAFADTLWQRNALALVEKETQAVLESEE